jgi:valyl-tRNA synthetase
MLVSLEKQLSDEEQFLQRMRSIMTSGDFLSKAPPALIEERKAKMNEVKHKITQLQFEIQKVKSEHI